MPELKQGVEGIDDVLTLCRDSSKGSFVARGSSVCRQKLEKKSRKVLNLYYLREQIKRPFN